MAGVVPWWRLEQLIERAHALVSPAEREAQRVAAISAQDTSYMEAIMAAVLRRESNCVDVGCHGGSMLKRMLRYAPDGRHIAIEPIPALASRLRQRFPGIDIREVALSDRTGTSTFCQVVEDPALSGLLARPDQPPRADVREIQVAVARLDEVVPADLPVSLVKIDVEGAEGLVLRGAEQTIRRCRPLLLVEHGSPAAMQYGTSSTNIWDLLVGHDMLIFGVDGRGPLGRDEFGRIKDLWNFLARPA